MLATESKPVASCLRAAVRAGGSQTFGGACDYERSLHKVPFLRTAPKFRTNEHVNVFEKRCTKSYLFLASRARAYARAIGARALRSRRETCEPPPTTGAICVSSLKLVPRSCFQSPIWQRVFWNATGHARARSSSRSSSSRHYVYDTLSKFPRRGIP